MNTLYCLICNERYESIRSDSYYCSTECGHQARQLVPQTRLKKLSAMAKNRAANKKLDYNIDGEFLYYLWNNTNGRCALTGIKFELGRSEKGKVHPYAPSVDRIVPSKGYVIGNVRLICYQMNVALSEFGVEQFEELVTEYISFNGGVNF